MQNYQPPPPIKGTLQQYQASSLNYLMYGAPTANNIRLNVSRDELITKIISDKNTKWDLIVKLASDKYGNPAEFWKSVKRFQGQPLKHFKPLDTKSIIDDSEDSDFGEEVPERITKPQEQANLFSKHGKKFTNLTMTTYII